MRWMSRRSVLGSASLALAGSILPGCARRVEPLRLGLHPWPANDLYFLADQLGHYEGAPIRIVDYTSAEQGLQAVRNGVAELYPCTLDEALLLASDLPDVRVVQVLDTSHGADVILAHADIPSLEALRGRRIGYEATSLGAYVLSRGLATAGLTPADVTPVFLQVDEHERAFLERRVDAVVTYEPVRSRLLAAGASVVFDSTRIPGEIVDVLVTLSPVLERQPDILVTVVRGWLLAAEHLSTRPREAAEALAPRLTLPADQVLDAFAGIHLADLAENRAFLEGTPPGLTDAARRLGETMVANRFLSRAPDLERLFDARIVARISLSSRR
ncbi:MAG: ABC transporter substrate-binding protein [Pseudomonadota bacterium]|nr:ABC transporter substrate-binding protein [Pseudomonadota bacterium]